MNCIIIGPQASGKGTQAAFIAEKLGIAHVSVGDAFRKEVATGSERGQLLKEYMDKGELIPEELNNEIVKEVLDAHPDGLILDGYPRKEVQAQFLDQHKKIDKVILLEVPDEECIERIGGRRVCANGHNYHVKWKPPKVEGVCDIDGLPLFQRDDDKPEAIKKRLGIYHGQTEPMVEHYDKQGVVLRINGAQGIDEVKAEIDAKLG